MQSVVGDIGEDRNIEKMGGSMDNMEVFRSTEVGRDAPLVRKLTGCNQ